MFIPKLHYFIIVKTTRFFMSVDYYDVHDDSYGIVDIKICKTKSKIL